MKFALAVLLTFITTAAAASPRCYRLSQDGMIFSRTPEVLCVDESYSKAKITLETGHAPRTVVATFRLNLLQRARCIDCNADLFGVALPSNSIFNNLQIQFNGHGMPNAQEGTVTIGDNIFYYTSF